MSFDSAFSNPSGAKLVRLATMFFSISIITSEKPNIRGWTAAFLFGSFM